jgi:uncharacterized protein YuzB (UPF0349 family)
VDSTTRRKLLAGKLNGEEHPCLGRCGECYEGPFLVVDGESVAGESHKEILDRITSKGGDYS